MGSRLLRTVTSFSTAIFPCAVIVIAENRAVIFEAENGRTIQFEVSTSTDTEIHIRKRAYTRARALTHTHTHVHGEVYIYVNMFPLVEPRMEKGRCTVSPNS